MNHFFVEPHEDPADASLIAEALGGNKQALERLIRRHQGYIYNIALRLFLDPDDALDATQEVLIKVITSLGTFRGESQFRTWLYRIVFNHFAQAQKTPTEERLSDSQREGVGFVEMDPEEAISEELVEEVRILCSTAMLMCLDREQRLLYIVGEVFGADHQTGAELFGITPANYRVRLHRARTDLLQYVSGKCGLVNPANPCRCPKKTKLLVQQGIVEKERLRFNIHYTQKIHTRILEHKDAVSDDIQFRLKALFQDSPFQVRDELDQLLDGVIGGV